MRNAKRFSSAQLSSAQLSLAQHHSAKRRDGPVFRIERNVQPPGLPSKGESDAAVKPEEAPERILGCHVDGDVESFAEAGTDERVGRGAVGILVAENADVVDRQDGRRTLEGGIDMVKDSVIFCHKKR